MVGDAIDIRPAQPADVDAIVEVHMQAFEGFLLTKIGRGFLRIYYRTVLEYPDGVLIVAVRDDEIAGFACGFAHPEAFSGRLRRQAARMLPYVLSGILRHPEIAVAACQNGLGVLRKRPVGYTPDPRDFELSSIAVLPTAQGHGIGRRLLHAIVDAARALSVRGVYLCTDAEDNERANRFYCDAGFGLQCSYMASGGRRRYYYRMPLEHKEPEPTR